MAGVTLKKITKTYGNVKAAHNVTLDINDHEFMVLVGPSGCGKTTVLRCIAGLEEPTTGDITIGGRLVNNIDPKDRDVAMVFQTYALYPHMSVRKNIEFPLKMRRINKGEVSIRVAKVAEMLGLNDLLERRPVQLSGGQRQRVALGRAIIRNPQVFLMDEPLSNLDAKMRLETRAELIRLQRNLGTTTIYVTHDQVEAMTMGDRIAVLKDGEIQQCDSPLEVYNKPSNLFVAEFIGSPPMNRVNGRIIFEDGVFKFERGAMRAVLPASLNDLLLPYDRKKVYFGIRPEHLYPEERSPIVSSKENRVVAKVDVVEPMGAQLLIYLKCTDVYLRAVVDSSVVIQENQLMEIVIDVEKSHIFDVESGMAIF